MPLGSSPLVPPIKGLDQVDYLTNETLFELREKPDHLLIIGGGPIGMEMAQAHIRLGCKVTVIEGAKALGKDDPEAAEVVLETLRAVFFLGNSTHVQEGWVLEETIQRAAEADCSSRRRPQGSTENSSINSNLLRARLRKWR